MKSATQWADEATRSADFSYETLVARTQAIQRDALLHAKTIAIVAITDGEGQNGIIRRIETEADKLT